MALHVQRSSVFEDCSINCNVVTKSRVQVAWKNRPNFQLTVRHPCFRAIMRVTINKYLKISNKCTEPFPLKKYSTTLQPFSTFIIKTWWHINYAGGSQGSPTPKQLRRRFETVSIRFYIEVNNDGTYDPPWVASKGPQQLNLSPWPSLPGGKIYIY